MPPRAGVGHVRGKPRVRSLKPGAPWFGPWLRPDGPAIGAIAGAGYYSLGAGSAARGGEKVRGVGSGAGVGREGVALWSRPRSGIVPTLCVGSTHPIPAVLARGVVVAGPLRAAAWLWRRWCFWRGCHRDLRLRGSRRHRTSRRRSRPHLRPERSLTAGRCGVLILCARGWGSRVRRWCLLRGGLWTLRATKSACFRGRLIGSGR